jgi:hypothetical protein
LALEHEALTERIIGAAIEVHRRLGPGFLESVYEKALIIELKKRGLAVQDQMSESLLREAVPAFLPSSCRMSGSFCPRAQPIRGIGPSQKCEYYARFSSAQPRPPGIVQGQLAAD